MENEKKVYAYDSDRDIKIERNCRNCEFKAGNACLGEGKRIDNGSVTYGMSLNDAVKMFPNGCDNFEISYLAYASASIV